ncbi:MAG TPA: aminotransferase class IV [Pseudolysinimonas sp.]|jgi:branched-subunit amino acid aminotransferase/4-amino-4-deoxychorismate lyase
MSPTTTSRWQGGALDVRDDCDVAPATILAADSWLVDEGTVLALGLHRARFLDAVAEQAERHRRVTEVEALDVDGFWDAAIASIPRAGLLFPRVELRVQHDAAQLLLRMRPAPELRRSLTLATSRGPDPRTEPRIKGPDLEAMTRLRTEAQARGADEAVLLSPVVDGRGGFVAEGSTTSIAWWAGDALCVPSVEVPRIDSVTLRSVLALAAATGVDVLHDDVTPEALDGCEVWALNALHGIRIVTGWIDGPETAELPGRLDRWQSRLNALRKSL